MSDRRTTKRVLALVGVLIAGLLLVIGLWHWSDGDDEDDAGGQVLVAIPSKGEVPLALNAADLVPLSEDVTLAITTEAEFEDLIRAFPPGDHQIERVEGPLALFGDPLDPSELRESGPAGSGLIERVGELTGESQVVRAQEPAVGLPVLTIGFRPDIRIPVRLFESVDVFFGDGESTEIGEGIVRWEGEFGTDGTADLVVTERGVTGTIKTPSGTTVIFPLDDESGHHVIRELPGLDTQPSDSEPRDERPGYRPQFYDESLLLNRMTDSFAKAGVEFGQADLESLNAFSPTGTWAGQDPAPEGRSRPEISVGFVFSSCAAVIQDRGAAWIQTTNRQLEASGLEFRLSLAAPPEVVEGRCARSKDLEAYRLIEQELDRTDVDWRALPTPSLVPFLSVLRAAGFPGLAARVRQYRDDSAADVVFLVFASPAEPIHKFCGAAAAIGADEGSAFAIVDGACFGTEYVKFEEGFTFAHELGHLMGSWHQVEHEDNDRPFPEGHGIGKADQVSMMAVYRNKRQAIWTGQNSDWTTAEADNKKVFELTAPRVAAFRSPTEPGLALRAHDDENGVPPAPSREPDRHAVSDRAPADIDRPAGSECGDRFERAKSYLFEFDEHEITRAQTSLETSFDAVVRRLRECPSSEVEVAGHTDSIGDPVYNTWLSCERARTVSEYLVSRGVAKERVRPAGYAATEPLGSNSTSAGRRVNRRVDLVATSSDHSRVTADPVSCAWR